MKPELAHLFTRPFWLDEWHTALVANRATIGDVFVDLYRASDMGPPVLHLVAWTVARFTGGLTPAGARIVSVVAVVLALGFLFAGLRRRFGVAASSVATIAVASHPMVLTHAFELRYYCLWLAFASALAWALGLDNAMERSRRRDVIVGVVAVLLCLTHWLAVLSLGLICAGAMATFGRNWRGGLRRIAPAAAGVVALLLATPLLFAQRSAVVEKSWMADATLRDVGIVIDMYWGSWIPILAAIALLVAFLVPALRAPLRASVQGAGHHPGIAGLVSLALLPFVLALLSVFYPAMIERYSIVTLLAWGPLVALAFQAFAVPLTHPAARAATVGARALAFVIVLFFLWAAAINVAVQSSLFYFSISEARTATARACGESVPVLFTARHLLYPAADSVPADCRIHYLSVSDSTLGRMFPPGSGQPRFMRFENEIARLHERVYQRPRVLSQGSLDGTARFILVGRDDGLPPGVQTVDTFGRWVFPRHRVTRLTEYLTLFERQ